MPNKAVTNPLYQGLAKPAQRALAKAGITTVAQLARRRDAELIKLHGMGPTGIAALKRTLAAHKLKFAS